MKKKLAFAIFFVALISSVFMGTFHVRAVANLEVDVQSGYENIQQMGKALPIKVNIKNKGPKFTGDLVIGATFDANGANAMAKKVTLQKGETKTVSFLLDRYYGMDGKNKLAIYEGGWEKGKEVPYVGKGEIVQPKLNEGQLAVISSNVSAEVESKIAAVTSTDEQMLYKNIKQFDVPKESLALDVLSLLIASQQTVDSWTMTEQKTMYDWLNQGGTLLVGSKVKLPTIFADHQPLDMKEHRTFFTNEQLNNYFATEDIEYKLQTNAAKLTKGSKIAVGSGNDILIAKRNVGHGAIVQTTFPLDQGTFANAEANEILVNKLYDQIEQQDEKMYSDAYTQLENSTKTFPAFHLSSIALIITLIAYIVLIAPVLYIILKKKDKREYAWWIIPVGALIVSLAIFAFSSKGRLTASKVQQSSIINVENGVANVYFAQSLLSNTSGNVILKTPKEVYMTRASMDTNRKNLVNTAVLNLGEKENELNLRNNRYWGVSTVIGQYTNKEFGKLIVDLQVKDGKLQGTVKNNLNEKLVDAAVWSGYKKYEIGDIGAGETLKVDQKISETFLIGPKSAIKNDLEMPTEKEELKEYQQKAVEDSAINSIINSNKPIIVGWMEKSAVPIEYEKMKVNESSYNFFMQGFDPQVTLQNKFTVEDQSFEVKIEDITNTGYADLAEGTGEWIIDPGSYVIRYSLNNIFSSTDIKWTELQLRFIDADDTKLSIYNHNIGKYEKITKKQTTIKENVQDYISVDGTIEMKLNRGKISDPVMNKPLLQLKGEAN